MQYNWIERLFLFFFPESALEGTPWRDLWDDDRKKQFLFITKIFFPIAAIIYVIHYYFVDIPEGLAPSERWFNYRFSMASISVFCFLFYLSPIAKKITYYKIPTILACFIFCYFQAKTIVWYDKVPYLYAPLFVFIATLVIQTNVTKSLLLAIAMLSTQWPSLIEANISPSMAISADIVTLIFIIFSRSSMYVEIQHFLLNQEKIDVQSKMIKSNLEFTDRIKAFLPKEISRRLTDLMARNRLSVLQAADEVLRQKKRDIACLFSDIRGFTEGSKQLDFLTSKVIPNIKQSVDIIESNSGIPRKIGDLVFAYYDSANMEENILNSLVSAFQIARATNKINTALSNNPPVIRYLLLSCGPAIVGNLGNFDSSIEITALGTPVNLLSRIDELTKIQSFQNQIPPDNIIISEEYYIQIKKIVGELEIHKIDLSSINAKLRNFESINSIYRIQTSNKNEQILANFIDQIKSYTQGMAA